MMKDLHSNKERYEFSERMQKIFDRVSERAYTQGEREGTNTNRNYDGKTPFLDAFEKYEGESFEVRFSHAIADSWTETEVVIEEDEPIVGITRPFRPVFEHFSIGASFEGDYILETEAYAPKADEIRDRIEKLRYEIKPLDSGRYIDPEAQKLFPEGEPWGLMWYGGYQGHTVPSYPLLFERGIDKTKEKIAECRKKYLDDKRAQDLYDGYNILLDGFTSFAEGYAKKAEEIAASTDSELTKKRMLEVASNCHHVAHKPPQTLGQAVQIMWFYNLWDWVDCVGRADQYLYPFYEKCVREEGREKAEEYICALWFKIFENGVHNVTIGGVKPENGEDATNELTYLMLQIGRRCHKTHPRFTVRIHQNTPKDLIEIIIKAWSEGMSDPTVTSDENAISGLMEYGVPIEDARDYSMLGCQEIEIPGRSNFGCEDGSMNLAKIFEYTFNNGVDRAGRRGGSETGYYTDYDNIEDMYQAYKKQVDELIPKWVYLTNLGVDIRVANRAKIVKSLFTSDCIERGVDLDDGGAIYNYGVMETCGSAAVADCFAAIQKVVFEDKKMTMETLQKAINANFEGYEKERQLLLHAPKFGNDDDYVDKWCVRVLDDFWTEIGKYRSRRGGVFTGACSLLTGGRGYGEQTWALPDGRFAGEPLSNSIGPREGNDKSGTTAMLNSVAKLPLKKGVGGTTLNVLLPKSLMQTDELRSDICEMMFVYLMKGGQMAQITTADREAMLDAQIHPENHKDLIVRVGGFSTEFINLSKENQDELISRYA